MLPMSVSKLALNTAGACSLKAAGFLKFGLAAGAWALATETASVATTPRTNRRRNIFMVMASVEKGFRRRASGSRRCPASGGFGLSDFRPTRVGILTESGGDIPESAG